MSNCPNTKKQHYISQFYLNYFSSDSNEETKEIWQYDKLKNHIFDYPVPIRSICYEVNIYELRNENEEIICPNAIEKSLAKIESKVSKAFLSIKRKINIPKNGETRCFLTSQEKDMLKLFMALTILRNKETIDAIQSEVKNYYGEKVTPNFARNKALNSCLPITEYKNDVTNLLNSVLSLFDNMSFQVGVTNRNSILTSDNPVIIHGKEKKTIFFPLFSNAVLYMKALDRTKNDLKNRLTELSDQDIAYFNKEIVYHSKRWVFASNKGVLTFFQKKSNDSEFGAAE